MNEKVASVPIVNAGDGDGEHPTQALLDLYTIVSNVRRDDMTITLCGDLKNGRTARSLCRLIMQFTSSASPRSRFIFCSPPELAMRTDVLDELKAANIHYTISDNLSETLPVSDVFYQTRVQRERFIDKQSGEALFQEAQSRFALNATNVATMKADTIILHPLPRVGEISPEVDSDPRALYFPEQTRNGLYIRMALLHKIFCEKS